MRNEDLGLIEPRQSLPASPRDAPGTDRPGANDSTLEHISSTGAWGPAVPSGGVKPGAPAPLGDFGEYELLEEISRGGMGVVYKARQKKADRIVALKMILSAQLASDEEVRRFHTESAAAAQLDHPHIVPVYDVGQHDGRHFFSMGYVEGGSLAREVAQEPLAPRRAVELVKLVAEAVAYAHARGIVHRDLKPSNILLDLQGRPRITDFGLAKRVQADSGLTVSGQVMGTPSYMPPEQASGEVDQVGPLSDVYSLGALLYHLLTGRPPFRAATSWETLLQVLQREPVPPRQLNPAIDRDLDTIVLKTLEKSPARRYPSAQEMAQDLGRYLEHRPITARRISALGRAGRWARRNKAVSLLLLCLACGTILTVVGAVAAAVRFRQLAIQQTVLRQASDDAKRETRENLYTAEMGLAADAARSPSGATRVRELLGKWNPRQNTGPDLRGWEWYFLHGLAHQETGNNPVIQTGGQVFSVAESPQGIIAFGNVAMVRLFDPGTATFLADWDAHDRQVVGGLQFSRDGSLLATGSLDGTAKVWQVGPAPHLLHTYPHAQGVTAISFSGDGKWLATNSLDEIIRLWDVAAESLLAEIPQKASGHGSLSFSPDGRWLATAGFAPDNLPDEERYPLRIWSVPAAKQHRALYGQSQEIRGVAWRPDGLQVAAGGRSGKVIVWDVESKQRTVTFDEHEQAVQAVAWSPDGRQLASGGDDFAVRVWDARDGREERVLLGHSGPLAGLCWSLTDPALESASADGTVRLWDLEAPPEIIALQLGEVEKASPVAGLNWRPDGRRLAATYGDPTKVWDEHGSKEYDSSHFLTRLCWSANSRRAAWLREGTLVIADGETFEEQASARLDYNPFFNRLAWSPVDDRVALMAGGRTWIWDVEKASEPRELCNVTDGHVETMEWNRDGTKICLGVNDGTVRLLDATTGDELHRFTAHEKSSVMGMAWHPTQPLLATAGRDQTVQIWDAGTWTLLRTMSGHTFRIWSIAWSPDGQRLATASGDKTVIVWDPQRGAAIVSFPLQAEVRSVAWNLDGHRLAAVSEDGVVKIWDATKGYEDPSAR